MTMTAAQLEAIASRGDTLVMAGAGTGKTRTLVRRCLDRLLQGDPPLALDQMLLVTFTEAAAAEIRQRIRNALEEELEGALRKGDSGEAVQSHLAALDTAPIGTLHSFCLRLIRQHFHELGIDPQVSVLAEEASALLADEVLDALFEARYGDESADAERFRTFLSEYARGREESLKRLLLDLHGYAQTRPDPEGWFRRQSEMASDPEPGQWRAQLVVALEDWRRRWLEVWSHEPADNPWGDRMVAALRDAERGPEEAAPGTTRSREDMADCYAALEALVRRIGEIDQDRSVKGCVGTFRKPLEEFYTQKEFLATFCPEPGGAEPLAQDWSWVREPLATLVELAEAFGRDYAVVKRDRGVVDFHDLEQFALRLLWDAGRGEPTELAREWRRRLELVFVDEYQDINEAQDTLIRALSRDGAESNRFLVGDVKQSIYRFRQAEPRIFQRYAEQWDGRGPGRTVFLSENFRSREGLLDFFNPLFAAMMRRPVGGVTYGAEAVLCFGNREERAGLARLEGQDPVVEVHLRVEEKGGPEPESEEAPQGGALAEATKVEREARMVAQRLRELKDAGAEVWDGELGAMRRATWSDMVVLLRAPGSRVEAYAKEFAAAGVPMHAKRTGFYDSIEVQDLIHVLELLDNPLQDLAVVAVLRSPLGGFTLDELARLRLVRRRGPFWKALTTFHRRYSTDAGEWAEEEADAGAAEDPLARTPEHDRLHEKADAFLGRYRRWRDQGRYLSLTQRLEMVLEETSYRDWLLTQPRGEQRQANVSRLLTLAKEFDAMHAQGLHRFLRMLEAQKRAAGDREPARMDAGESVRLMSIHQSKGLEFPIVVAADLDHKFNLNEERGGMVLDEELGLCPVIHWPETGQPYPSLPLWMSKQRQRSEALGEELRILYVAMTRAQDHLILAGTAKAKELEETWPEQASPTPSDRQLLKSGSVLGWLGPWLCAQEPGWTGQEAGQAGLWSWQLHRELESRVAPVAEAPVADAPGLEEVEAACGRLVWEYSHDFATLAVAKSSVSALRRAWSEQDEEASPAAYTRAGRFETSGPRQGGFAAAEIGSLHHRFLQWVDLGLTGDDLELEVRRLTEAGRFTAEEAAVLDVAALERFWRSEVGAAIRSRAVHVSREWPFTCRVTAEDLAGLGAAALDGVPEGEFVVVQGVADLVVVLPEEAWLLDFKTDHFKEDALDEKVAQYRPQLQLYALALSRILQRPVTRRWLHFLSLGRTAEVV